MGTLVSSDTLKLSAFSTAANTDISRNAGNGLLNLSFSDLLRGQMQSGAGGRASELPAPTNVQPTRTSSSPEVSREAPRETSRMSGDSSTANPANPANPQRPSQEPPAREPTRTSGQNEPSEAEQTVKRPTEKQDATPSQHAETDEPAETGEPVETSEPVVSGGKEKTAGNNATTEHALQPQLSDAALLPDLPTKVDLSITTDLPITTDLSATIAVLLSGMTGEVAQVAPEGESVPEASAHGAMTHGTGHPRHSETLLANLPARTAVAMQADGGMENNAGCGSNDDQGTNPNAQAMLASRPLRQAVSADAALSGTGNESSARINVAAALGTMANAANTLAAPLHEAGGARTAPTGASAGEISMLNPPRLPAQASVALPQFTIPAGAGQRAWAEEIGNRVMWMLGRAESRAELILTPPHLGKVEVSIHLNGDQSTAQFFASSQSAREALEQAMPRLRELLAQAGINLGEASVNTSAEDRAQDGENTRRAGTHTTDIHEIHDDGGDATDVPLQGWSRLNTGLINTFA